MRWLMLCLAALLLSGCARTNPIKNAWTPNDGWWATASGTGGGLKAKDGAIRSVSAAHARNLRGAYLTITAVSGVNATLSIVEMDSINAFATVDKNGQNHIAFSLSMLDQLGDDQDALATITGHELAHLYLGHGEIRKQRAATASAANQVIGTVLAQVIPFGGLLTSVGTSMVTSSFSRDEEREADERGLEWAMNAGFDPCGSARTMRVLSVVNKSTPIPFLSSHPGHEERAERAARLAKHAC